MQIELNKEKTGMLFIDGVHNFTHADPGPIDVDITKLSQLQFSQVKGNIIKGLLLSDNPDEILRSPVPITAALMSGPTIDPAEPIVDRSEQLKSVLNGTIPTVKKNILGLAIGDVRKLLLLEKKGKKRKSLIEEMELLLKTNEESVKSTVGNVDVRETRKTEPTTNIRGGLGLGSYLANVSEVIESDKTEIVIKTTDDEE